MQQGKFGREWHRLRRQARSAGAQIKGRSLGPVWPMLRSQWLRPQPGEQPATDRIAIHLLFQPGGLAESTLKTLQHLGTRGFAPLVVCNGGMPQQDVERLKPLAWQVLPRPNIGYDFGGYADAIWWLQREGVCPDELLILNDTLWLPALQHPKMDSLDRLLSIDAPYAALCNFPYRQRKGRTPALVGQTYPASFMMRLTRKIWQSPAFANYWRDLTLHGAKARVVESGEIGFSRALRDAGFDPVVLHDHAQIHRQVLAMPPDAQRAFVQHLPVVSKQWRAPLDDIVSRVRSGALPDEELASFLDRLLPELNPWDSLAVNGLVLGDANFIKKANLKNARNAQRFLAMTETSGLDLLPSVEREIRQFADCNR